MKKYLDLIFSALAFAWSELFDLPAPRFLRKIGCNDADNPLLLSAFPFLGLAVGAVSALIGWFTGKLFTLHFGALIFALATWLVLSFKDSGRSDARLIAFIFARIKPEDRENPALAVLNVLPGLIRFLVLFLLGLSGKFFYLALLLAGAFTLQAALAVCDECEVRFIPELPESRKFFHGFLIAAGGAAFIFSAIQTLAVVAAVAVLYLIFRKKLAAGSFDADGINFAGSVAEWSLLIIGLLI